MAEKHPHLFEKEIKAISPRTFGVDLTGVGYGVAADITGISNDFPHTNPRNAYLYEKLLKAYAKNVDNSTDVNFGSIRFADFFPDQFEGGNTPAHPHFGLNDTYTFFDINNGLQIATGVPLADYSGHCVFFNSGKPYFHPNSDEQDFFQAGENAAIQTFSGGQTGFYRALQLTGVKFNNPGQALGGPMKKVYLNSTVGHQSQDIFFTRNETGAGAANGTPSQVNGGRSFHLKHITPNNANITFGRQNLHNDFGNFRLNGTYGFNGGNDRHQNVTGTGLLYSRQLTNGSKLKRGHFYRLLFTRVQNGKIVEHLRHSDELISGISYLELFKQNYNTPGDGVHVHVFNFDRLMIKRNSNNGGPAVTHHYSFFQQSGNTNSALNGGVGRGKIDVSAFNLYTARLD